MTAKLQISDFPEFFRALHDGCDPFPWQIELAKTVCKNGYMPSVIDLPTAMGKTVCIDVALFHLAYSVSNDSSRVAPLRIAWVVDRRIVVDQAYKHARLISEKLQLPDNPVLEAVRDLLQSIAGENAPPLVVQRLRGGMPREGDWARTPTQPTVLLSTVDQVGSRLLFRGYGTSRSMRPIHAGLLGEDALIIADEVHLAEPFRQTLEHIGAARNRREESFPLPWQFVELSATPRVTDAEEPFRLGLSDYADGRVRRRIGLPKRATLVSLGRTKYASSEHAGAFAETALKVLDGEEAPPAKRVLVVVNRINLARRIYDELAPKVKGMGGEITLLIGRNREVEKDRITSEVVARCASNASSGKEIVKPYVVVATQCVEVGADLDFEMLVTQIAPLDALRQRFGRLNRIGHADEARAFVLAVSDEVADSAKAQAPYGLEVRNTWKWLQSQTSEDGTVDLSSGSLDKRLTVEQRIEMSGEPRNAPVLMPEHIHAFSMTSRHVDRSSDPSLYLHGEPAQADVNIVWRADLPRVQDKEIVANLLSLLPPRQREALPMPIGTVRRWLLHQPVGEVSDITNSVETNDDGEEEKDTLRVAWRWRGADDIELVSNARNVIPGDTIVLSADEGGCDPFGWNPRTTLVNDVADEAAQPYRTLSFAIRLQENLYNQALGLKKEEPSQYTSWNTVAAVINEHSGNAQDLVEAVDRLALPDDLHLALSDLKSHVRGPIEVVNAYAGDGADFKGEGGAVLFARRGLEGLLMHDSEPPESSTEDDRSACCSNKRESLFDHSQQVRERAARFASGLGLSRGLCEDLALAGFLHDCGKVDSRFQAYLAGSPWDLEEAVPIAKSGNRRSRREDAAARSRSGLPRGWRHEALSVRIAREHPEFARANDPELVLWLIGTHHGHGRVEFPREDAHDRDSNTHKIVISREVQPLQIDPSPGPQRTDFFLRLRNGESEQYSDWSMLFILLKRRYGVWGLAWLEALLRLADHRASEESSNLSEEVVR